MTVYYLDASAWVKRYFLEEGTEWVQSLFTEGTLLASASLGFVEVIATLARKAKISALPPGQLKLKTRQVRSDWNQFVQVHLSFAVLERAESVAEDMALRGADAVHLASVLHLRNRLTDSRTEIVLVASDLELLEAARVSGLSVVDPVRV
ncbi:MAG: type II toxin-antitoxin system VapC family toxin [Calditrichaeota bacterium]|nr:type II toxin-antitoxin system VapC family toxin [Calditrichota bacterium]